MHGCWQGGVRGRGVCVAGGAGVHGRGACMAGGHVWWGGVRGRGGVHGRGGMQGACMAGGVRGMHTPPRDTAGQCAGGTHPTGMHSCLTCV